MCTLAVFHRMFPAYPLIVAANRDEFLARPALPPGPLPELDVRAVGGRDLIAGGTWLGLAETGLVAGMLNRRSGALPDPTRRSRGLLCLELLGAAGARAAAATLRDESPGRYNPFNLLAADREDAFVVTARGDGGLRVEVLPPGLHLLTNLDVDDPTCPRIAASHQGFAGAGNAFATDGDLDTFVARLRSVLADHATALDPRGPGSLCLHLPAYGTRSSTVLVVPRAAGPFHYFHADGPPCRTALARIGVPF
ncbi:MAG TPA: NRDE family protein [Candidatus Nitrosopolaris sp.]|nr:NRDE family protein [Candidatus Nitrosopolaris sp.]